VKLIPGQKLQAWLDPRLDLRPSAIQGRGLFTRHPIQSGEVVLVWGGTILTAADIRTGKARSGSASIVAEGLYLADDLADPDSPDYFLNHSCDPNLWLQDEITLIARREIQAGEEVTGDYALWETDPAWVIEPCRCGALACRGRITGNDWQIPALQQRYRGHFVPLINQRLFTPAQAQMIKPHTQEEEER
jgi:hypothetical protein